MVLGYQIFKFDTVSYSILLGLAEKFLWILDLAVWIL